VITRVRRAVSSTPSSRSKAPGPVLLRHQAALQLVGKLRDRALQALQLVVEIGAQARQLFGIAKVRRLGDFIIRMW
jgi:hypothetical protein